MPAGYDPLSEDAKIIAERANARRRFDHFWQRSIERNPRVAAAIKVQEDFEFLAAVASGEYSHPRHRRKAARILARRFGAVGARQLITNMLEMSDTQFRLIIRKRDDAERPDRGKARKAIDQQWQDYLFLEEFQKQHGQGLSRDDAIAAAQKRIGLAFTIEGGKKVLARARKDARKRGFTHPYAPFVAAIVGYPFEPDIKVADLARPGRPKKATRDD